MKEIKFKENLRNLRIAFGLSQAQLAEKLDVNQRTVSAWEKRSVRAEFHHSHADQRIFRRNARRTFILITCDCAGCALLSFDKSFSYCKIYEKQDGGCRYFGNLWN